MSGDAFAEFERAGWERAAPRYEEYWTDTVLFVEPLLDAAGVRVGSRLLDVACGPGFVSEAAAARGACPVGVDIATAMVERARMRRPDLTFVVGDALRLPFPDPSFDAVTMNFGILHVSQPERALAEVHRVLVPSGRLAFTTWLAQGNAEDEITEAALAAHAIPVEGPEGPSYHVFGDRDESRRALAGWRVRYRLAAHGHRHRPLAGAERRLPLPSTAPCRSPHRGSPARAATRPARGHPRGDGRRCSRLRRGRGVRATDRRTPHLSSSVRPCC